jgi:hypothetical protein
MSTEDVEAQAGEAEAGEAQVGEGHVDESAAPDQQKQSMTFDVPEVTGDTIIAHYITLNGANPSGMNNKLFLWQVTADSIPVGHTPNAQVGISKSDPEGSQLFDGLSVGSRAYVVGYAVGPCSATSPPNQYENVAATVYVPASATTASDTKPHVSTVTITYFADGIATVNYTVPPGMQPGKNLDWVGIFNTGDASDLYTQTPVVALPATATGSKGNLNFSGVTMQRGNSYTVGYFKGGYSSTGTPASTQSTLASTSTIDY